MATQPRPARRCHLHHGGEPTNRGAETRPAATAVSIRRRCSPSRATALTVPDELTHQWVSQVIPGSPLIIAALRLEHPPRRRQVSQRRRRRLTRNNHCRSRFSHRTSPLATGKRAATTCSRPQRPRAHGETPHAVCLARPAGTPHGSMAVLIPACGMTQVWQRRTVVLDRSSGVVGGKNVRWNVAPS